MKIRLLLSLLAAGWFAALAAASEPPSGDVLISRCGEYVLTPDLTLTVATEEQEFRCAVKQTGQGPGGQPFTVTDRGSLGKEPRFLFCWQPADQRLWWATAESLDRCDFSKGPHVRQVHHTLQDGQNLRTLPTAFREALGRTFPR